MKTVKTFVIAIVIMVAGISTSFAQFNTPSSGANFSLKLFGAMPMGDFAQTSNTLPSVLLHGTAGNVDMGAGLGFKIDYRFDFGLGIFISGDAMWNQLNADVRTNYDALKKTKPNYVNFPIMLGLDYKCYFGNVFGLYAEGGAGANLLYITPEGWSNDLTEFRLSAAFAWEAGGGILLGKNVSLGVHYYALGNQSIESAAENIITSMTKRQLNINILTFRLGITF